MYRGAILKSEAIPLTARRSRAHKHFQLDPVKIKCAQRVLRAGTETEAIERALDLVISEYEGNRLAAEANERFLRHNDQRRLRQGETIGAPILLS